MQEQIVYKRIKCKHIAAVALAINEENTIYISSDQEPQEESWEQLITDAKPKDLRNFMLDYGVKNQDFRHQIRLAFSKQKKFTAVIGQDGKKREISHRFPG